MLLNAQAEPALSVNIVQRQQKSSYKLLYTQLRLLGHPAALDLLPREFWGSRLEFERQQLLEVSCCKKIAEAEAVVSVNEKKWLVMHVHVHV